MTTSLVVQSAAATTPKYSVTNSLASHLLHDSSILINPDIMTIFDFACSIVIWYGKDLMSQ